MRDTQTTCPDGGATDCLLRRLLDQQTRTSVALANLLGSLDVAVLHLRLDFTLAYFTAPAAALFGLSAGDLGQPLRTITLRGDLEAVARTGAPRLRLIDLPHFGLKQCRILPLKTRIGAIEGVLVIAEAAPSTEAAPMTALTPRQHQIMDLVLAGQPSKTIAADLHISQRTVENHRAAIMQRTGARSLPALARMALGV